MIKFFKRKFGSNTKQAKQGFSTITRMGELVTRIGRPLSLAANKEKGLWVLGRFTPKVQYSVAVSIVVVAFLVSASLGWHSLQKSAQVADEGQAATSVAYHASQLAVNANMVLAGNVDKLGEAEDSVKIAQENLDALKRSGMDIEALNDQWKQVIAASKQVFANAEPVHSAAQHAGAIREAAGKSAMAALRIQTVFSQTGNEREAAKMAYAQQLASRIQADAQAMTHADKNSAEAAARIERDSGLLAGLFAHVGDVKSEVDLSALVKIGADSAAKIQSEVVSLAKDGAQQLVSIAAAKKAGLEIADLAGAVYSEVVVMQGILHHDQVRADGEKVVAGMAALFVVAGLWLFAAINLNQSRIRERGTKAENERQQNAILKLLNEMGDIADGDLTVKATVSEEITGALADSFNHTVLEMSALILEIAVASRAVDESSTEVRENAYSGADAVMAAVAGMNEIREQVQETAKRIKRLGESSQEISEIVNIISDISEQTNILAMNASIQAASAGEAGRGFSVVASEVQKLAERAAESTRSIGALVQTIQTDVGQAVASMESSTQAAVEEAKRTQVAAEKLKGIVAGADKMAAHAVKLSGSVAGFKIQA